MRTIKKLTAENALKLSENFSRGLKGDELSLDTVLWAVRRCANSGFGSMEVYKPISNETVKELEELGYKVLNNSTSFFGTEYKIIWNKSCHL